MADFMNGKANGKTAPSISSSDAQATLGKLKPLLEKAGLTAFAVSPAQDSNAFAVSKKLADANHLTSLSDLAKLNKPIRLAATTECPVRPFCQPGLEKTYGLKIADLLPLGFGTPQAKQAVVSGKADMVLTGTTDATLDSLGLVLLKDDKGLQNADNLVPIVNTASANKPEIQQALDKLSPDADDRGPVAARRQGGRPAPEGGGRGQGVPDLEGSALSPTDRCAERCRSSVGVIGTVTFS